MATPVTAFEHCEHPVADIEYRQSEIINFREAGADFRWIDVKEFALERGLKGKAAVAAVIADAWYDDDYASPSGTLPDPSRGIHGPYRLSSIGLDSFERVSARACRDAVREWAGLRGDLSPVFTAKYEELLTRHLANATAVFRLGNLGPDAEHQWGGHIGQFGFLEFVIVAPREGRASLLVASDD